MGKFNGKEYPLSDIFSKKFLFSIPHYQRPYCWEKEAERLFDDLYDFYIDEVKGKEDKEKGDYFLGSILLIKEREDRPESDVIDGQQRLTTLTLLLTALAYRASDDDKEEIKGRIYQNRIKSERIEETPRLTIRERDNDFFEKYVSKMETKELIGLTGSGGKAPQNDSQKLMRDNTKMFIKKIKEKFDSSPEEISEFLAFIMTNCFIVVVSSPAAEYAYRIFSIMNMTGRQLLQSDIIKAELTRRIGDSEKSNQRIKYSNKWEECEQRIADLKEKDENLDKLFSQLVIIKSTTDSHKALTELVKEYVIPKIGKGETLEDTEKNAINFIDEELVPYSNAYSDIKGCNYKSESNGLAADETNKYFHWLNKSDNTEWIPVAMKFYYIHSNNPEYMCIFFKKLDRLVSCLKFIPNSNRDTRTRRYIAVLKELEQNPENIYGQSIELTPDEIKQFTEVLDGEIYTMTGQKRNYILKRLDAFMNPDGKTPYDSKLRLTIEHILPQNPAENSQWKKDFTEEDVNKWLNRVANLIMLRKGKNSEASNKDYKEKKEIYTKADKSDKKYSSGSLFTSALNNEVWTPEVLEKRQEMLIGYFKEMWEL